MTCGFCAGDAKYCVVCGGSALAVAKNKVELLEEDLKCVHRYLDDHGAPRNDAARELSIVGRIRAMIGDPKPQPMPILHVSGDAICPACERAYRDHELVLTELSPSAAGRYEGRPYLRRGCHGRWLKL